MKARHNDHTTKPRTELRNKVLDGVNTLVDYVATTLGPKGQNVSFTKKTGAHL